jgi:hypothetical protein
VSTARSSKTERHDHLSMIVPAQHTLKSEL